MNAKGLNVGNYHILLNHHNLHVWLRLREGAKGLMMKEMTGQKISECLYRLGGLGGVW